MSVQTVITITHPETAAQIDGYLKVSSTNDRHVALHKLVNYLDGLRGGAKNASVDIQLPNSTTAAAAHGTLTFTGAPTAADTCAINGVTFTAETSGATGNQFNIGGTVTISATNLAAAINASVTAGVAGVVTATSAAGVVTVTAVTKGKGGNSLALATSLTNTTVSAANLAGGVNPAATVYHFGL